MYYKIIKNNKVIDVLDNLIYLKWQPKHKIMLLCNKEEAQVILGSDGNTFWHEESLYKVPILGIDEVVAIEIDEHEYKQLKMLNLKTPEEIIDEYNLLLLDMGVI